MRWVECCEVWLPARYSALKLCTCQDCIGLDNWLENNSLLPGKHTALNIVDGCLHVFFRVGVGPNEVALAFAFWRFDAPVLQLIPQRGGRDVVQFGRLFNAQS